MFFFVFLSNAVLICFFVKARKKRKLEDDDDIRISINTTGNAAPHDGSDNRATMKINVKERYKREDGGKGFSNLGKFLSVNLFGFAIQTKF